MNERAKLLQKPERHQIPHFYKEHIPAFSINTLSKEEMIAEKMAATIGRNKPRDHFDLYKIIMNKTDINLEMVKKKCEESGVEFNIIKMFNNANKLHSKWNDDLISLIREKVTFQEIMQTLAKHFKLKHKK
ncbi:nucleotidyl transferase AbiEii/AbiGii toxin family protein [archaeon]|nr:nucleotidyl transferase AbiEii/AbiGii toxin family protein [archaeon]